MLVSRHQQTSLWLLILRRIEIANDLAKSKTGLVDPPPKRIRRRNKLKSGPETDGAGHATSLIPPTCEELMEANNEGNTVSRTSLSTSKSSRPAVVRKAVGWNVAIDAVEVATAASPKPAPDPRCPTQSPEFESEVERADSIEAHSVQMEMDPGLARYSEGIAATPYIRNESSVNAFRLRGEDGY
jgi:hypothetical protein